MASRTLHTYLFSLNIGIYAHGDHAVIERAPFVVVVRLSGSQRQGRQWIRQLVSRDGQSVCHDDIHVIHQRQTILYPGLGGLPEGIPHVRLNGRFIDMPNVSPSSAARLSRKTFAEGKRLDVGDTPVYRGGLLLPAELATAMIVAPVPLSLGVNPQLIRHLVRIAAPAKLWEHRDWTGRTSYALGLRCRLEDRDMEREFLIISARKAGMPKALAAGWSEWNRLGVRGTMGVQSVCVPDAESLRWWTSVTGRDELSCTTPIPFL